MIHNLKVMDDIQLQNLTNKVSTLENQMGGLNNNIETINFKAFGREGLKNLKKTVLEKHFPIYCSTTNSGVRGASNYHPVVTLADGATKEAYFSFIMPRDLSVAFMELIWDSPAATGNLYWQVDISSAQKGEVDNARTTGGTAIVTATSGAHLLNYTRIDNATGVNTKNLKRDDMVSIRFQRLSGDATDTLGDLVNLYGIKITYF